LLEKAARDAKRGVKPSLPLWLSPTWVPYIVVVGERERGSRKLQVRIRGKKEPASMTLEELESEITGKTKGKPYRPLPLPLLLSKRPKFVG